MSGRSLAARLMGTGLYAEILQWGGGGGGELGVFKNLKKRGRTASSVSGSTGRQ